MDFQIIGTILQILGIIPLYRIYFKPIDSLKPLLPKQNSPCLRNSNSHPIEAIRMNPDRFPLTANSRDNTAFSQIDILNSWNTSAFQSILLICLRESSWMSKALYQLNLSYSGKNLIKFRTIMLFDHTDISYYYGISKRENRSKISYSAFFLHRSTIEQIAVIPLRSPYIENISTLCFIS